VWIGSDSVTPGRVALLHAQGVKVLAEFNTLHVASYVTEHPEAAPLGADGRPCPPPHAWQGVSPTDAAYRPLRMAAFRELLATCDLDGVWLDHHHAHASWERGDPALPDTGLDRAALAQFHRDTGIRLPDAPTPVVAELLLGRHRAAWTQ